MEITSLGHSCFRLKGKQATLVTDPFDPEMTGLKFPRHVSADIVTVSHQHRDHNFVSVIENETGVPVVFSGPGEYESKGVEILGIPSFHDAKNGQERGRNTIYKIIIDGLTVVHLGDLGQKLEALQTDQLGDVDILFVPVGGVYTLDPEGAANTVAQLEPKIVIPMHYRCSGMHANFELLADVSEFLKEVGEDALVPVPKFKITREAVPDKVQVVLLQ